MKTMADAREMAGKGALIAILVVEAIISAGAVAVGVMTDLWMPVIIVLVLAAAITMMTVMRLNQAGK